MAGNIGVAVSETRLVRRNVVITHATNPIPSSDPTCSSFSNTSFDPTTFDSTSKFKSTSISIPPPSPPLLLRPHPSTLHAKTIHTATTPQQNPVQEIEDWKHFSVAHATSAFSYALRWLNRITTRPNPDLRDSILERIPQLREHYSDEFTTASERQQALLLLIRNHQRLHVKGKTSPSKERLVPVSDSDGMLRCKGRLLNSDLSESSIQPILLGPQTPLATLVIQDAHKRFHLETAHTKAEAQSRYWIPQLSRQVQKVIQRCVPCQRMNNLPYRYPTLPDLASRRVTKSRPFQHVGIDYFGAIAIKSGEDKSKTYGIIITCTVTRLIHLECVPDITTVQLLDALRRFFARLRVPETITSYNAPYFTLEDRILREAASPLAQASTLSATMATKGITRQMITPYAPWQGAFYETLIKTINYSLYKTI
uniref:Integrase catalytic domain-containing protein n=1 Tax=Haemonchus contortus TaxID=6289 RepID=A0A7I4YB05_HAECO